MNKSNLEIIRWLVVVILLTLSIINNYYNTITPSLHTLITVIFITMAVIMALLTTKKGKDIVLFFRETRVEVRKVIWPNSQETFQITVIVAIVTTLMSLVLWGIDSILVRIISFITSVRF